MIGECCGRAVVPSCGCCCGCSCAADFVSMAEFSQAWMGRNLKN
jgi:hypothetical protein